MENDIVRMLFLRRQRQKKRWKIKTISGAPPLSFKAKAGVLKDYRIYGQTSRNLFDGELLQGYWAGSNGDFVSAITWICTNKFKCKPSTTYTFSFNTLSRWYGFAWYDSNGTYINSSVSKESTTQTLPIIHTATSPANAAYMAIDIAGYPYSIDSILPTDVTDLMIVEGSTPLPYEPYGESVGDRTGNLCENSISGVNISSNGFIYADIHNDVGYAKVVAGETYTINSYVYAFFEEEPKEGDRSYDNGRVVGTSPSTFEAPINGYVAFRTESGSQLQCNEGNNLLPYEPYGYRVPVTVTNDNNSQTTNLYLPEQIRKVGEEAEYISYDDQKLHRIGADDIDVNLPELPTLAGTNELTVGTVVQPSGVEITGRIKKGE